MIIAGLGLGGALGYGGALGNGGALGYGGALRLRHRGCRLRGRRLARNRAATEELALLVLSLEGALETLDEPFLDGRGTHRHFDDGRVPGRDPARQRIVDADVELDTLGGE